MFKEFAIYLGDHVTAPFRANLLTWKTQTPFTVERKELHPTDVLIGLKRYRYSDWTPDLIDQINDLARGKRPSIHIGKKIVWNIVPQT